MITKPEMPVIPDNTAELASFGARPDALSSNTEAFKKAIESLHAQGGGHLVVPRGIFRTGPIKLLDRIDLHLERGAVILFDKNKEEYPLEISDYEGVRCIRARSQLYARGARDISITGEGVIDGNGQLWRPCKEWRFTEREWRERKKTSPYSVFETEEGELWYPTESSYRGAMRTEQPLKEGMEEELLSEAAAFYDFYRPCMVQLEHCERILLEGVSFINSPAWGVHPLFCRNLSIRGCYFRNDDFAQNGDGLDIESCSCVEVSDSLFDTGDDAICIKSGKNREARKIQGPSEHISVHGCRVLNGHGGFVIGSEMSRGVNDVEVENCDFIGTDTGIRLKSALGRGGCVRDIRLKNIRMIGIKKAAITMTMGYVLYSHTGENLYDGVMEDEEDIPEFSDIHISDTDVAGAETGIYIEGLGKGSIHDIFIENTCLQCDDEGSISGAGDIHFKRLRLLCSGRDKSLDISISAYRDRLELKKIKI